MDFKHQIFPLTLILLLLPLSHCLGFLFPETDYPFSSNSSETFSDDNPATFNDPYLVRLAVAHIVYNQKRPLIIPANQTFLPRRYDFEPEGFKVLTPATRYFPLTVGCSGEWYGWRWGADLKLAGVNVFKFKDRYYFDNPIANTMDDIYLYVKNDLQFYRFRARFSVAPTKKLAIAAAPLFYLGSYSLLTIKEYHANGEHNYCQDYSVKLDNSMTGAGIGLQLGGIYLPNLNHELSLFIEYNDRLRFRGRTTLETETFHTDLVHRLPLRIQTLWRYKLQPDLRLEAFVNLERWGGELYIRQPEVLELDSPNITTIATAGIGATYTVFADCVVGLGYRFLDIPQDSDSWKFMEMDDLNHAISLKTAYAFADVEINFGVTTIVENDSPLQLDTLVFNAALFYIF